MKRKTHTDEQIIRILKEHKAGLPANEAARKHENSPGAFNHWKSKYDGMEVAEAKRLKQLEAENTKLKRLLADALLKKFATRTLFAESGNADSTTSRCRPPKR